MSSVKTWTQPIAVVDLETTGLRHADGERIIEVAIVRLDGLHDTNPVRYSQLINPSIPIPTSSTRIHGIDDSMVSGQPAFADVADEITQLLSGAVFVAHNAPFDRGFLQAEFDRVDQTLPEPIAIIDTLRVARTLFAFPSCALGSLATRMQLNLVDHHRALADADATTDALRRMLSEIDPAQMRSIDGFLDYMRRMKKGGTERASIKSQLCDAAEHNGTLEIAYTDVQGPGALITRRRITVDRVRAHNVEAWCHLRSERRVFRLERIQRVDAHALVLE